MSIRTNGSGENIKRTTNLPTSTAFSLMGWSKVTVLSGWQYIGLENNDVNASAWLLIGFNDSGGFEISTSYGGGAAGSFASQPSDETWFFWAITNQGTAAGDFKGYWASLSATSFVTTTARGVNFTSARLSLGNDSYDEWIDMSFSYVKVYSAALTSAELWQEMQAVRPIRTANLNIFSPLWNTSDVNDYSGNGYNWSINGTLGSEDNPPIGYGVKSKLFSVVSAAPASTLFRRSLSQRTGSRG
jgi:hypothetical protein